MRDGQKSGSGINIPDSQHCLDHSQSTNKSTHESKYLNWAPASCRRGPHRGRPRRWRQTARRTHHPGCPRAGQQPSNVKKRSDMVYRKRNQKTFWNRSRNCLVEVQIVLIWTRISFPGLNRNVPSFDGADLGTTKTFCFHFRLDVGTFVEHLWNVCGTFLERLWNICGTFAPLLFWPVLRTRIRIRIHMCSGLLDTDPDPLVRGKDPDPALDPDPDPSIIMQ